MSIYTISSHDNDEYKSLICGRTNDLNAIIDILCNDGGMHSAALFGERRIGKTSLLYLVRDVVNGTINNYTTKILDLELRQAIPSFSIKVSNIRAVYITLHDLGGYSATDFCDLIDSAFQRVGIVSPNEGIVLPDGTPSKKISPLVSLFTVINAKLSSQGQKMIVLMDEFECILDSQDCHQICRNLRSIIETCPEIGFIFAGAEYWHKKIKDKSSPLANIIRMYYLKAPAQYPIQQYLVAGPLKGYLAQSTYIPSVVAMVAEWTGDKPCYVQAVCDEIVRSRLPDNSLSPDWITIIEPKIFVTMDPILDSFYSDPSLDQLPQLILVLLANHPNLSVKQIGQMLGYSEKDVWNRIDDLLALDKVRKQGGEYRITGSIIEKWGKKNRNTPKVKTVWPTIARWGAALGLLLLAILIYIYTHPSNRYFSFSNLNSQVTVWIPSSLEENENGIVSVAFTNKSQKSIKDVSISLLSDNVFYNDGGTNRVLLPTIEIGETIYWEPQFSTGLGIKTENIPTQLVISVQSTAPDIYEFKIAKRALPLKRYWELIGLILTALIGFATSKDLVKLFQSLISLLPIKTTG